MKQKQLMVDPATVMFMSLKPGDSFIFPTDLKENNPAIYMAIEDFPNVVADNWQEGYEVPNVVAIADGEHGRVLAQTEVIPVEAEVSWRMKIVQ
ncbi:hypothetical protein CPT_MTx_012 [Serratia phage MTx]|uniref:Uncharacterized protein n=1 Tax=Serratia phage MTx TaxID=2557553 RepID=A0A482MGE3_9CAUD|nr:hypothetical protein HWC15_gp012 [Serratia phage MTx]QBQ72318.1 hypothetical protein CPT_MTx_012 [Serratia phage MTx]